MYVSHVCQGKTSSWNFVWGPFTSNTQWEIIRYLGENGYSSGTYNREKIFFRNIQNKSNKA